MLVGADGNVAVVQTAHHVYPLDGAHFHQTAPRRVGIGAHAWSIEEDADRIAVEAVLHEDVIVRRDQEVIAGADTADPELDAVVEQSLLIRDVHQSVRLPPEYLLHREDVADVLP